MARGFLHKVGTDSVFFHHGDSYACITLEGEPASDCKWRSGSALPDSSVNAITQKHLQCVRAARQNTGENAGSGLLVR